MDVDAGRAFIGRAAELDRLAAAYARAATGQARLAIVAGEAGIGKTRLVEAAAARATAAGALVLTGACLPLGTGGLPYAPFIEAFRTLLLSVDPATLPALLGPNRRELARLMPEIRVRLERAGTDIGSGPAEVSTEGPTTSAGVDDRYAQARLFELVLGLVGRLTRAAPVVLVVEDLHWADPSTRDLLAFLERNLRDERVLLVGTVRTDEPDAGHALRAWLAELLRSARADRVDLDRFNREDLARLLAEESGRPLDRALVDRTWERCGGNPFYAEQVLAATRETGDDAVPDRLRDVLLARLAAVSEAGQEVLRVASAAGARIDDELLVAVADLPAPVVRAALREVVERRILVPAGGLDDPHVVFSHALLREVIHAELLPGERALYHARFAAALERRSADHAAARSISGPIPTAAELAYHWDAAGDLGNALWATIDAGLEAERTYAFAEAHRLFLRALALWDRRAAGEEGGDVAGERVDGWSTRRRLDRVDLLVRAAETAILIGEYKEAIGLGRRAIGLVDAVSDPGRAAALHERQRWYLWEAGDRVGAADSLAEAERLIPAEPPSAGRARILAHRAGLLMADGRLADSIPVAEEAISVARAVEARSDEALALGVLGWDLALLGRVDEGLAHVRHALDIADELGGVEGIALGATNLAVLLDRVGRTTDALEVGAAGWERIRALGVERTYGGLLLAISAKAAIALGRWDEADGFLRLGLERDPVGTTGIRLRIQRGRLDTFRGDLAAAEEALAAARAADEAAAEGGSAEERADRAALLAALAELAATGGRLADARAAVADGLVMAADGPPDPALASLAAAGLRVEADAAESARARHDELALADARRRARRIVREVDRVAGLLVIGTGVAGAVVGPSRNGALAALCHAEVRRLDARDEADDWRAVARAFDAIGRPYPSAYAHYREGGAILRSRESRTDAGTALEAARATASRLLAAPLLTAVDTLARHARLDIDPGGSVPSVLGRAGARATETGAAALTARETEVLRMLAAGWSNQEIADALFISRKTASVHASHIFDKLGAANRVEAAAIAHRLGLDEGAPPRPDRAQWGTRPARVHRA